jgi:Skp family chaperone for outer membrane proteins
MIFDNRSRTVKSKLFLWPVLALAVTLTAQAQQGKFAVINIQGAIISTKDGQKAAAELNAKTAPKKKELEQKQNEINSLQDQLNKGSNTLSDTAKNDLYKEEPTARGGGCASGPGGGPEQAVAAARPEDSCGDREVCSR